MCGLVAVRFFVYNLIIHENNEVKGMETTLRKIGNSVGAIIPSELHPTAGTMYQIVKVGDTFVMTPERTDLFAHDADWVGFRDSVSQADREWDEDDD